MTFIVEDGSTAIWISRPPSFLSFSERRQHCDAPQHCYHGSDVTALKSYRLHGYCSSESNSVSIIAGVKPLDTESLAQATLLVKPYSSCLKLRQSRVPGRSEPFQTTVLNFQLCLLALWARFVSCEWRNAPSNCLYRQSVKVQSYLSSS